jgi:hypothetical protein
MIMNILEMIIFFIILKPNFQVIHMGLLHKMWKR